MKKPDRPQELTRMLRETFSELRTEAQIAPLDLRFPPEVIQTLQSYAKVHSLDGARLIPLAMEAHINRLDLIGEEIHRLMQHPESFDWPLEDPILCVALAFMRKLTDRWADKVHEKFGLTEEELDPADWWKTPN
jgi:hypothetical protein